MEGYTFILDLALILLSTKVFGLVTKRFQMPQVVGALFAGLLLGPAMLGWIKGTEYIQATAEIGVIVLMFVAGMETDAEELKKSGKSSFIIAVAGVIVPLIGGFFVAKFFNRPGMIESDATSSIFLQNIFIGIILTATSVSITVETLKEMGKLKTKSGNAILGAAIIDDILGIIGLTIVTSMADSSISIMWVLIKIILFFVFSAVAGFAYYKFYTKWSEKGNSLHRYVIITFVFCLLMSYIAEEVFGVANITGAYIAGLILSMTPNNTNIASKFDVISYLYLSPVFFTSIGLKVVLPSMNKVIVIFAVTLTVVAVLTKIIGCGLAAKFCKYKNYQSIRIGVGMVSRGEVALIVASKGAAVGLLGSAFLGPIVIVVVITTIITPILLKLAFKIGEDMPTNAAEGEGLSRYYEQLEKYRRGDGM